jgi:hypothetical protein
VNRKRVHLANPGMGVNRQLVHLGNPGMGVNRKRVHLGSLGNNGLARLAGNGLHAYLRALADRLRRVRVCCGDWSRVVTDGALAHGDPVGIFLDPPYSGDVRDAGCYSHDTNPAGEVRDWAVAHGDNPRYRIALCGYEGEHTMPESWECVSWKAGRAYGRHDGQSANMENRHKERIWCSPHCLRPGEAIMQRSMEVLGASTNR